jgi:hypothetical protein
MTICSMHPIRLRKNAVFHVQPVMSGRQSKDMPLAGADPTLAIVLKVETELSHYSKMRCHGTH